MPDTMTTPVMMMIERFMISSLELARTIHESSTAGRDTPHLAALSRFVRSNVL